MLDIKTSGRNRLFINTNGDRFVNEGAARDVLSKAVFAQPGSTYWLVQNKLRYPDENAIDLLSGRTMRDMLAQGRVKKAANLDELAKIINVDPNRLKAAIESYNKVARHEVETDQFGFKANHTDDRPMTEGRGTSPERFRPFTTQWAASILIPAPTPLMPTDSAFPDFMQPAKLPAVFTELTV